MNRTSLPEANNETIDRMSSDYRLSSSDSGPVGNSHLAPSGSGSFQSNAATIFKYNPQQMSPSEVLDTFVGRDELLKKLIARIRSQRGAKAPKHVFLHGPRGIGKTTMLLVLRHTIAADPGLSASMDVLQFSEEERRIANLPSFAVRTLDLLCGVRPDLKPELKKAQEAPEEAFKILMEAAARQPDRPVLLLVDNFDDLVIAVTSGKSKQFDAKRIKPMESLKKLLASPCFLVIAAALQDPARRKNFPAKLLPYFAPIIPLEPLRDPMAFLRKRAEKDSRARFLEALPKLAPRIDGLNRLADGNPRLLVFLYDCLGEHPLLDLVEIVQRTVDDLTPMYQDVIDRLLNRGQAAVLETLVAAGGVGTVKDIATRTFQEEPTVRTFMNDLCALGLAVRAETKSVPGREKETAGGEPQVYRTYPPLFQIWYEMRHLGREQSLYLVRFFSLLSEPEEARRALGQLDGQPSVASSPYLRSVMADVVDLFDPEWDGIWRTHVHEVLNKGGALKDALAALDQEIARHSESSLHRAGLFVVRSRVKTDCGDFAGAEEDMDSARNSLPQPPMPEGQIKILVALSHLLNRTGEYSRAIEKAQSASDLCEGLANAGKGTLRASALLAQANASFSRGDNRGALRLAMEADRILAQENAPSLQALCASIFGRINLNLGSFAVARDHHEKALALRQQIADRSGQAVSLNSLGTVWQSQGEYARAQTYCEKALAIFQQIGDRNGEACSLCNLGNVWQWQGEYARAQAYYEKALAIEQQIGERSGEGSLLGNLGNVWRSLGEYARAQACYENALAIERQIGDRSGEASSLCNLGNVWQSLAEYARAQACYVKALAITRQIGYRKGEAAVLGSMGAAARDGGRIENAVGYFRKAHALSTNIGDRPRIGQSARDLIRSFLALAAAAMQSGDMAQASCRFAEALNLAEDAGPEAFLSGFVSELIVPCLGASLDSAGSVLPLFEPLKKHKAFANPPPALKPVEAAVRFFASGRSASELNGLGPTEMMLASSLTDQIERPEHLLARELLQSGKAGEARKILERILGRTPSDVEALSNLARAHVALGELEPAEQRIRALLTVKPGLPMALLLSAQVHEKQGRVDEAIKTLQPLVAEGSSDPEVYGHLAALLRQRSRFGELVDLLVKWRDSLEASSRPEALEIWIPEARLLAGDLRGAAASMPAENFVPTDPNLRVCLGSLRVFLALEAKDGERARRLAANLLESAADAPPGKVSSPFDEALMVRAKALLGEDELRFFMMLVQALGRAVDPVEFANRFLTESEAKALGDRAAEEGRLAVDALRAGRIQGFQDLSRITTRSIGPAAGLGALGGIFSELTPAQKGIVVDVATEAIRRGLPAEAAAGLSAVAQNFPQFQAADRSRCLEAVLDLSTQANAAQISREQAVGLLNVLYPNLTPPEREQARTELGKARQQWQGPALLEFFNETVPQVDHEKKI